MTLICMKIDVKVEHIFMNGFASRLCFKQRQRELGNGLLRERKLVYHLMSKLNLGIQLSHVFPIQKLSLSNPDPCRSFFLQNYWLQSLSLTSTGGQRLHSTYHMDMPNNQLLFSQDDVPPRRKYHWYTFSIQLLPFRPGRILLCTNTYVHKGGKQQQQ